MKQEGFIEPKEFKLRRSVWVEELSVEASDRRVWVDFRRPL